MPHNFQLQLLTLTSTTSLNHVKSLTQLVNVVFGRFGDSLQLLTTFFWHTAAQISLNVSVGDTAKLPCLTAHMDSDNNKIANVQWYLPNGKLLTHGRYRVRVKKLGNGKMAWLLNHKASLERLHFVQPILTPSFIDGRASRFWCIPHI